MMSKGSQNMYPIQDRLIAEAEKKKENLEKAKRKKELEEMKQCTFQPKTNTYKIAPKNPRVHQGGLRSQTPLHERIDEL